MEGCSKYCLFFHIYSLLIFSHPKYNTLHHYTPYTVLYTFFIVILLYTLHIILGLKAPIIFLGFRNIIVIDVHTFKGCFTLYYRCSSKILSHTAKYKE